MSYLTYDKPKKKKGYYGVYAFVVTVFLVGLLLGLVGGYFMSDVKLTKIETLMTELININKQLIEFELEDETLESDQQSVGTMAFVSEPVYAFTDDEIYLMAQLLCGQAGKDGDGEYDFETQITKGEINWPEINKVLEVVMNRVLTPGIYADNVTDVIMQPGAFEVMPRNASRTPSPEVVATVKYWCDSFNSPEYVPSIPSDHYWFSGSRGGNITRDHW